MHITGTLKRNHIMGSQNMTHSTKGKRGLEIANPCLHNFNCVQTKLEGMQEFINCSTGIPNKIQKNAQPDAA